MRLGRFAFAHKKIFFRLEAQIMSRDDICLLAFRFGAKKESKIKKKLNFRKDNKRKIKNFTMQLSTCIRCWAKELQK